MPEQNKSYLVSEGKIMPYDEEYLKPWGVGEPGEVDEVSTFLYWKKENILIASLSDPWRVISHERLFIWAKKFIDIPEDEPDGAGNISDGKITGWKSIGYDLETPNDLRPRILEALGIK